MPDDARLQQLQATIEVSTFTPPAAPNTADAGVPADAGADAGVDPDGDTVTLATVTQSGWEGSQYSMNALFHGAWFGPRVDDMTTSALTITDSANPGASVTIPLTGLQQFPVFGGDPAIRSLLFDNINGTLRQRVIERDGLFQSSLLNFGFTDWRADQIVQKTTLNTQIGTAMMSGRGGNYETPIYGQLVYQLWIGYSEDGGTTFAPEMALTANTASRFVNRSAGRTVYEGQIDLPSNLTNIQLYMHVKATLIADYSGYSNITQKFFSDGQQILLKEAWDNPSGPGTNYQFPVNKKP
jgi:hypothetical protein